MQNQKSTPITSRHSHQVVEWLESAAAARHIARATLITKLIAELYEADKTNSKENSLLLAGANGILAPEADDALTDSL